MNLQQQRIVQQTSLIPRKLYPDKPTNFVHPQKLTPGKNDSTEDYIQDIYQWPCPLTKYQNYK